MADQELDETIELPALAAVDRERALTSPGDHEDIARWRVDLLTPQLTVVPGATVAMTFEVRNTTPVIEHLEVRLLGMIPETCVQTPADITLFPGETVRVTLDLTFATTLPAGEHEALLVVGGRSGELANAELEVSLLVPARAAFVLELEPPVLTTGKRGVFEVLVRNTGNTEHDVVLAVADADRKLEVALNRRKLHLGLERQAEAVLIAQGRRPRAGSPVEHLLTLTAESGELTQTVEARLRQKAILTPGIITLLLILLVITLWSLAMLLGVGAALAAPDPTKLVPAEFATGIGRDDLDPAVVGGTLSGSITAATTGAPLPRITAEVFDADGAIVGATATADDGTYELDALVPGRYRVRFRGVGFAETWWPSAPSATGAEELPVTTGRPGDAGTTALVGLPGSLGGQALVGDGVGAVTSVEITALDLLEEADPIQTTTDADGVWSVTGLPAPATYRIRYETPGYAPVEFTQLLEAGQQVAVNPSRLPAAPGSIAGTVVDRDGVPLGGVEVIARFGDTELATTTPTSGAVGTFELLDLETPGTYLLTFVLDGYASETQGVALEPGATLSGLEVVLFDATGTIRGQATSAAGGPLGGATVTVSGGGTVLTTETLTSGAVGSFRLSGLPLPGIYTVTFDAPGFGRQSVQVQLGRDAPDAVADAVLASQIGRITGTVLDAATGRPVPGAAIEVSDGESVRTTTTASAPQGQVGRFNVGELVAGTYTITATTPDGGTLTILETLGVGVTTDVTLRVAAP